MYCIAIEIVYYILGFPHARGGVSVQRQPQIAPA